MITPTGWEGNDFNSWTRTSTQQEVQESYLFPRKHFHGGHDYKIGGDVIHRGYQGTSTYHPVQLLRADNSLAGEITFGPAARLAPPTRKSPSLPRITGFSRITFLSITDCGFPARHSVSTRHSRRAEDSYSLPLKRGGRLSARARASSMTACPFSPEISPKALRGNILFRHRRSGARPAHCFTPYYEEFAEGGRKIVPSGDTLGSTPYNITWNAEFDQEIRPSIIARVSFLASRTLNQFTVSPQVLSPTSGWLLLSNLGASRYHEFDATLRVRPSNKVDFNISYVNSQARGDLNTMASVFVPYEQPVIQPNQFGTLPTNVPDRIVTWGRFKLPAQFIVSPLLDWHSGFPFSIYDELQNYVGPPNSRRFPTFLSPDVRVSKDFKLPSSRWWVNTCCGSRSAYSTSPTTATTVMYSTPLRRLTLAVMPDSNIAPTTCPLMSCTKMPRSLRS